MYSFNCCGEGLSQPYSLGGEVRWIIPRLCKYNRFLEISKKKIKNFIINLVVSFFICIFALELELYV
nr:MAG TPA: hypothetical protein [Crassvirales sp.]